MSSGCTLQAVQASPASIESRGHCKASGGPKASKRQNMKKRLRKVTQRHELPQLCLGIV